MTLSMSPTAYTPEYEVFEQALESPRGVRIAFTDYPSAYSYRHRLHHARSVDKRRSREIYSLGDPGYDSSQYDPLIVRLREDETGWHVYIEHNRVPPLEHIPEAAQ